MLCGDSRIGCHRFSFSLSCSLRHVRILKHSVAQRATAYCTKFVPLVIKLELLPQRNHRSRGSRQEMVYFDRDGDHRLEVDSKLVRMRRHKSCLFELSLAHRLESGASPVFKAILYGSLAEVRPADPSVSMARQAAENNPIILATLLNIMHGAFAKVSKFRSDLNYTASRWGCPN